MEVTTCMTVISLENKHNHAEMLSTGQEEEDLLSGKETDSSYSIKNGRKTLITFNKATKLLKDDSC